MYKDIFYFPIGHWYWGLLFLWAFIWKGMALWKAARLQHKWWFVVMLVVNTLGILEILYIYVFSERKLNLSGKEHHEHPTAG